MFLRPFAYSTRCLAHATHWSVLQTQSGPNANIKGTLLGSSILLTSLGMVRGFKRAAKTRVVLPKAGIGAKEQFGQPPDTVRRVLPENTLPHSPGKVLGTQLVLGKIRGPRLDKQPPEERPGRLQRYLRANAADPDDMSPEEKSELMQKLADEQRRTREAMAAHAEAAAERALTKKAETVAQSLVAKYGKLSPERKLAIRQKLEADQQRSREAKAARKIAKRELIQEKRTKRAAKKLAKQAAQGGGQAGSDANGQTAEPPEKARRVQSQRVLPEGQEERLQRYLSQLNFDIPLPVYVPPPLEQRESTTRTSEGNRHFPSYQNTKKRSKAVSSERRDRSSSEAAPFSIYVRPPLAPREESITYNNSGTEHVPSHQNSKKLSKAVSSKRRGESSGKAMGKVSDAGWPAGEGIDPLVLLGKSGFVQSSAYHNMDKETEHIWPRITVPDCPPPGNATNRPVEDQGNFIDDAISDANGAASGPANKTPAYAEKIESLATNIHPPSTDNSNCAGSAKPEPAIDRAERVLPETAHSLAPPIVSAHAIPQSAADIRTGRSDTIPHAENTDPGFKQPKSKRFSANDARTDDPIFFRDEKSQK